MRRHLRLVAVLSVWTFSGVALPSAAVAQEPTAGQPVTLSGPRFGVTFLSDGIVEELRDEPGIDVGSLVTQFGWQFEKRLSSRDNGLSLLAGFNMRR
jgi:hypothetical protein